MKKHLFVFYLVDIYKDVFRFRGVVEDCMEMHPSSCKLFAAVFLIGLVEIC